MKSRRVSAARRAPTRSRARRAPAALLARALRGLTEGVLIAEPQLGRDGLPIVFCNDAFCAITGYDSADLIGRGHAFLHLAAEDLSALRRWRRRVRGASVLTGEGYLNHKNGVRVYAAWSYCTLADASGRVTHLVGTYRDMTEKRRLQEELMHAQRLDAVGRLAGGVAHDFNNLLSVINGYCEILADTVAGDAKARKEVAEIHQAGQRASTLVRQLLAFGRRQTMDPRVINLNQLIRENFEILRRLLSPDKSLHLALDEGIANVRVDVGQLQQVLLNLTINARDAVPPGGQVTLGTSSREINVRPGRRMTDLPPGRYVVLSVSDNGSGMDAATRAHLFEPFFSTKGEGRGTGLGLALVYGVVEQSGGHILVHSVPKLGSTFEILLPAVQEPAATQEGSVPPLPITRGRETILLVEDDDVVRKMVAGILTADGYRVLAVASAADALQRSRRQREPVHLVITDCATQGHEGSRLVHALQQTRPMLRVLCTTGQEAKPVSGIAAHHQTVVAKPFALSTLLRAVRRLLDAPDARPADADQGPGD